jgi:hypothetical protein
VLLHHRSMGHPSFSLLSRLYLSLFEKANDGKLVYDACEFGKYIKSSYVSSDSRSPNVFDLVYFDV